jgi:hypothetical protein
MAVIWEFGQQVLHREKGALNDGGEDRGAMPAIRLSATTRSGIGQ